MVKKANGKWRMCVDFTDLNKACPKDCYLLPRIDQLVDATSEYGILSFLDAFSGYHQIKLHEPDQIHTSFRAAGGIYCYTVMPFGLKNVGATYQRMINQVLEAHLGRNVEAYVDDMVIKTIKGKSQVEDLLETFNTLTSFGLKLNPSKCTFGVRSGKFLGFMMTERGIEANPDKITALINLKEPTCVKDVQRINRCIAALGQFVSKAIERCLPFFKVLKVATPHFAWTSECKAAWASLKEYLMNPHLLSSPTLGETLYIYLATSDLAIASVLLREVDKKQLPVYYVRKALNGPESRYPNIEKLAYTLVVSARKLRAYFESHPITVYTNAPLRQIYHKLDQSGRMLKWSIELCGYDITFAPRTAIKAQALADFLVEATFSD